MLELSVISINQCNTSLFTQGSILKRKKATKNEKIQKKKTKTNKPKNPEGSKAKWLRKQGMDKNELRKDFEAVDSCEPQRKDNCKWDIYGKNQYCPVIKVTNWWYHREGFPKDNDDYVKAAYNRWGTCKEDKSHWTSETMESMELGRGDTEQNALRRQVKPKKLLSFLSYPMTLKPRKDLLPEDERKILPTLPRDQLTLRYISTNQAHYKRVQILPK